MAVGRARDAAGVDWRDRRRRAQGARAAARRLHDYQAALDYNVVVVEDCCSSATDEIQRANIDDMRRMGAVIISEAEFEDYDEHTVPDLAQAIRAQMLSSDDAPEPFDVHPAGWPDLW